MKCVHGVPVHKDCPDCIYEYDCEQRGVKPENRFKKLKSEDDYPSSRYYEGSVSSTYRS